MSITLADQYYVKALESYPYCLEEVIESLNYALSYDTAHAGANYLMGKLYMKQFQNYEVAETYFIAAISSDLHHLKTYEGYSALLIKTRRFSEAKKLIQFSYGIDGVNFSKMYRLEALMYEYKKDYVKSKQLLKLAMTETFNQNQMNLLLEDIKRIEQKQVLTNGWNYDIVSE